MYISRFEEVLPENDPVTRQYETLPYPPVSDKDLKEEELYYRKYKDSIRLSHSSNSLENINHYLHRGNENFR